MGRLEGKVAVITGAARGQGRSHAVRLAQEGADIIALDVCAQTDSVAYPMATSSDLAETVRLVQGEGQRVLSAEVDVRNHAALAEAVTSAVTELGRLDVVSANAGIATYGAFDALTEQTWNDVIDTNLTGVWNTVRATVPHIRAGGRGGSIVLTGSTGALKGYPNTAHYIAAKHGVVGLMKSLAAELAVDLIRVNSVNPTSTNTPMLKNQSSFKLFVPGEDEPTEEQFAAVCQSLHMLPVPWVEPEDISNAVLFLMSDESRYVTGVSIPVDAGLLAR